MTEIIVEITDTEASEVGRVNLYLEDDVVVRQEGDSLGRSYVRMDFDDLLEQFCHIEPAQKLHFRTRGLIELAKSKIDEARAPIDWSLHRHRNCGEQDGVAEAREDEIRYLTEMINLQNPLPADEAC